MPSFDIVSRVDMQEMDNAVNQVKKEISTRFDFRGSKTSIDLDRKEGKITVLTEDDMKLRAIKDMLIAKVVRRDIEAEALDFGDHEKAGGDMVRQMVTIHNGIDIETARKVVKSVKDAKLKVQAAIQGEEVRVTGKQRDDLQDAIHTIKEADFGMPLQFVNYREYDRPAARGHVLFPGDHLLEGMLEWPDGSRAARAAWWSPIRTRCTAAPWRSRSSTGWRKACRELGPGHSAVQLPRSGAEPRQRTAAPTSTGMCRRPPPFCGAGWPGPRATPCRGPRRPRWHWQATRSAASWPRTRWAATGPVDRL